MTVSADSISFDKGDRFCKVCCTTAANAGLSSLLKCKACKCVMYCGEKCQKADRKNHKPLCDRAKHLPGLEGKVQRQAARALADELRWDAIYAKDPEEGMREFLLSCQIGNTYLPIPGGKSRLLPDVAHPVVRSAKLSELRILALIWRSDIRIPLSQAKDKLRLAIDELVTGLNDKMTIAGLVYKILYVPEVPAVWQNAFERLCEEDHEICAAVEQISRLEGQLKKVVGR